MKPRQRKSRLLSNLSELYSQLSALELLRVDEYARDRITNSEDGNAHGPIDQAYNSGEAYDYFLNTRFLSSSSMISTI